MGTSKLSPVLDVFMGWGAVTFSLAFGVAIYRGNVVASFCMLGIAIVFIGVLVADFIWRIRNPEQ